MTRVKQADIVAAPEQMETQDYGYSLSQKAADACREIVEATAITIEGRRYVGVEGYQAIAIAHGCVASARDVEAVHQPDGLFVGYRAVGEVRRMADGVVIATGEGYVGHDETTWFGGKNRWGKVLPKRPDYAIRAMTQTRGISRACRSAFAHVVVIINRDLGTTPAEEMQGLVIEPEDDVREGNARAAAQGRETFRGQHRKAGAPMTKDQMLKRQDDQAEAAVKWIDDAMLTVNLFTSAAELAEWENNETIKPRLDALRQGRDHQPGYEHLEGAWKYYEKKTEGLRP